MSAALAYVNWGRWVADCPVPGCHDAQQLTPGALSMMCADGHMSPVQWPGDAKSVTAISDALNVRPDERNRNWYPAGQPVAVAAGYPVDQTPADLDAETAAHNDAAADLAAKQVQLVGLLGDLGLSLQPDGTITGNVIDLSTLTAAVKGLS